MALESVRSVLGLVVVKRRAVTMERMARRCWQ